MEELRKEQGLKKQDHSSSIYDIAVDFEKKVKQVIEEVKSKQIHQNRDEIRYKNA